MAESIAAAKRRAGAAPDKRAELDWRPLSFLAYDRLIVMDGFATADDLRRRLGFPWPEANEAALGSDADDMVLVFSVGRRVVAWAHVGRDDADFACLAGFRLMRREALMVLTRSSVDGHAKVALQTVPRRYRKRPACLLPA